MRGDAAFWSKTSPAENGCIEWRGAFNKNGYGVLHRRRLFGSSVVLAHRYAFYLSTGNLPELCVCHTCDNRLCVNFEHLFLGTVADNNRDKMVKGRHRTGDQVGENNGAARLRDGDVRVIKHLIKGGYNNTEIARLFDVTHQNISNIRLEKTWASVHITDSMAADDYPYPEWW